MLVALKSPLDNIYTLHSPSSTEMVPQHQLSTRVIVGHSQSLAWWLTVPCQMSCVTLQSTRQPSQDP